MQGYIGYIRVSTVKQGTKGVSLIEQRDAIMRYAERNHFTISVWLEEMETAAKLGRPVFNQALKLLRTGKARGIILHKLDRGARNLRDWAAIGELSDQGAEIHFVNESLDLHSRGGRLSADIQAVVAADYIRNLREETRKGFYGRLKQGLYPLAAPLGYLDTGKGKPKEIDAVAGPLVRKAFELYGSARFNLDTLGKEMHQLGMRNKNAGRVTRNGLSTLLNNPFYIGLIRLKKTGESFSGIHEPLISKRLFERVHAVLQGRIHAKTQRHNFMYRKMLTCATCHYALTGEQQKGHVYYRCHTEECPLTSIREEVIEREVARLLQHLCFHDEERAYFKSRIVAIGTEWTTQREDEIRGLNLRLGQLKDRLNQLTDAYLDQALDKTMFEERKKALLLDQRAAADNLAKLNRNHAPTSERIEKFLELAGNAWLSHQMGSPEERREMVSIVTSNRRVEGKKLTLEPSFPFCTVANRFKYQGCDLERDVPRTWDRLLRTLTTLAAKDQLPDLSSVSQHWNQDTKDEKGAKG